MRNLTPSLACEYLLEQHGIKRTPATLAKLRCMGGSPQYFKAGRYVLYPMDALEDWAQELLGQLRHSTSEGS